MQPGSISKPTREAHRISLTEQDLIPQVSGTVVQVDGIEQAPAKAMTRLPSPTQGAAAPAQRFDVDAARRQEFLSWDYLSHPWKPLQRTLGFAETGNIHFEND